MTAAFFPSMTDEEMLPEVAPKTEVRTRWFCGNGAVVERDDGMFEVVIGGVIIGWFSRGEPERRNLLLVALSDNPSIHPGDLARAFRLSTERLRQIREFARIHGAEALFVRRKSGRAPISARLKKRVVALFEQGLNIDAAYAKVKRLTSRASVGRIHKEWAAATKTAPEPAPAPPEQLSLVTDDGQPVDVAPRAARPRERRAPREVRMERPPEESASPMDGHRSMLVQHVGTWLMTAQLHADGLYDDAERFRSRDGESGRNCVPARDELRVALDAAIMSLSLGQRCIEGVRRLATPSADTLLFRSCPSARWTREVLHDFAAQGAALFHLGRAHRHARALATETPQRVVAYVDNHLRKYTGKHVIRKGWKMQEKRVVPGVTDYYVHDSSGRPLLRMDSPEHAPLVDVLRPIAGFLRSQIGAETPILLVFDRAGAFPEEMSALRNEGFEFVTYERRPFPAVPAPTFESASVLRYRKESIRWVEDRQRNLLDGRGRVRRISFLTEEGAQINVLAASSAPAPDLLFALLHRWSRQENQFKHGIERWGINQLDGRRVEPYDEDAVIPNPARRRLELDVHDARRREGDALRELAHLSPDHLRRERFTKIAAVAFEEQEHLLAARANAPKRAPVRETELSGKLRRHPGQFKLVVDTLRAALGFAETNLAALLAAHLTKPREAKKTLHNLLAAPGTVTFRPTSINVRLRPAATLGERAAFRALLRSVNASRHALPGDPHRRPLRFSVANS